MVVVDRLSSISFETIHSSFVRAFSDYDEPIELSVQQLKYMIERRGVDLGLSFGAFDNDKLVGFTLNGIGDWNGKLTAYDSGTGITKEFRKKRIATKLFKDSLPVLRDNNITQYLLEVIRTNKKAFDLYSKAGFKVIREFDYYVSTKENIEINNGKLNNEFAFEEISNPDWDLFKTFWDFNPSWQNSIDAIKRKSDYFIILGIFDNSEPVGYGVIEKETGDIPQLGIDKRHRRKGLSTTLFHSLLPYAEGNVIKILNADARYDPFKNFAESLHLIPGFGQYEMMLKL